MKSLKNVRIAIIGAGLAGLTAAYRLKQANGQENLPPIDFVVFEATDRVGGRVRTLRNTDGLYAEAGALLMTDAEKSLLSLVNEMGLNLISRDDIQHSQFFVDGKLTTDDPSKEIAGVIFSEIAHLMDTLIMQPQDWCCKQAPYLESLDQISIFDFCIQKGFSAAQVKRSLSTMLLGLFADGFDAISALSAFRVLSQYRSANAMYSVEDGNDRLPQAVANAINVKGDCIFFNAPVSSVCQTENCWNVTFTKGQRSLVESFDYVVMATPLSALQSHHQRAIQLPNLPSNHRNAIDAVNYNQSIARVYCEVNKRFWEPQRPTAAVITDRATCWIEDHTVKQRGNGAFLEAHFAGARGHEIQKVLDPAKSGEEAISEIYGNVFMSHLKPRCTKVVFWSEREYQWGAYPYFGIGQRKLMAELIKPVNGELYFIGEYTSMESPVSMQGAVESGNQVVEKALLPLIRAQAIEVSKKSMACKQRVFTEPPVKIDDDTCVEAQTPLIAKL